MASGVLHQNMWLTVLVVAGAQALHGDITQSIRERTLKKFRDGKLLVLVATDVAARGLDIPAVDLVVHYELPTVRATPVPSGQALATGASLQRRTQAVRPGSSVVALAASCTPMLGRSPPSPRIRGGIRFGRVLPAAWM